MRAVAYCRVSTNKDEQLDSLESQQNFFGEYAKRNKFELVKIYADEGKSGTKIKNRTQLLRLLADAERKSFDVVLIKDVSRLARNTVDFLTSIRKLKSLEVKVVFVNYDQTSSDSSEFMLTMLSAIAQEESANTSKRVKFGKKMNAEKGKVPNFVYGYDKIAGDYFNLKVNQYESGIVKEIFDMYANQNMGENKIALMLNRRNVKTKRGCNWSQNAISRILTNEIYVGNIINGKQEIENFLTGERKKTEPEKWLVTARPELKLIDKEVFDKVQRIRNERKHLFKLTGERKTEKNIFSKLIKCTCCGASFRKQVRVYKNTYVKWLCSGRNSKGTASCKNTIVIDENELLNALKKYFVNVTSNRSKVAKNIVTQFNKKYKKGLENRASEKELTSQLNKLKKTKQKYIDMFDNDIINIQELKTKTAELNVLMDELNNKLEMARLNISKESILKNSLNETFEDINKLLQTENITNNSLSRIIEKITINENGKINVYLKLLSDLGLGETVHIMDDSTYGCNIIERFLLNVI